MVKERWYFKNTDFLIALRIVNISQKEEVNSPLQHLFLGPYV